MFGEVMININLTTFFIFLLSCFASRYHLTEGFQAHHSLWKKNQMMVSLIFIPSFVSIIVKFYHDNKYFHLSTANLSNLKQVKH